MIRQSLKQTVDKDFVDSDNREVLDKINNEFLMSFKQGAYGCILGSLIGDSFGNSLQ